MTKKSIIISGRVINGNKYGRQLGFPTANIDRRQYAREKLRVKLGVWAGRAEFKIFNLKIKNYRAAIVIGPMDKTGLPKLEAHLLNFKGNLYGRKISIYLDKYIRPFKKFKSEAELKKQIGADLKIINTIL